MVFLVFLVLICSLSRKLPFWNPIQHLSNANGSCETWWNHRSWTDMAVATGRIPNSQPKVRLLGARKVRKWKVKLKICYMKVNTLFRTFIARCFTTHWRVIVISSFRWLHAIFKSLCVQKLDFQAEFVCNGLAALRLCLCCLTFRKLAARGCSARLDILISISSHTMFRVYTTAAWNAGNTVSIKCNHYFKWNITWK